MPKGHRNRWVLNFSTCLSGNQSWATALLFQDARMCCCLFVGSAKLRPSWEFHRSGPLLGLKWLSRTSEGKEARDPTRCWWPDLPEILLSTDLPLPTNQRELRSHRRGSCPVWFRETWESLQFAIAWGHAMGLDPTSWLTTWFPMESYFCHRLNISQGRLLSP